MRRANFFALTPTPSRAGRTFSRARHSRMATLKPTTPLRPKNAPKTPVSHPRRRHRFQPHTGTNSQRRQGFQRTEPPGLRGLAAVPVGGGRARAATHERQARPIGGRRGACGAWPGFETTRRAKLAARTARGRAGHAAARDLSGQQATPDNESAKVQTHSAKTVIFGCLSPHGSALWQQQRSRPRPRRHLAGELHYTSVFSACRTC